MCITHSEGFFELQKFILFPLQTIYFHHKPYPDFQTFLKSSLLPCTAHCSLPVHNLLPEGNLYLRHSHLRAYPFLPSHDSTLPVPFLWSLQLSRRLCFSLLDCFPCNARRSDQAGSPPADNTPALFSSNTPEYYGAAEPPVRCGESHLSGLTEPPHFFIKLLCHCWVQSIYFSHREVFSWVNTFNIDLIGIIRYAIHDGIGKSTFTITDLLVPLTFTELRTKDC